MFIGFIGNVNNYSFSVALALQDLGHQVRVVVDSEDPLHRPEYRFGPEAVAYGDWAWDISPLRVRDAIFPTLKHLRVERFLAPCDVIVATGLGIAFLPSLGKPCFAMATGSDLDVMANDETLTQIEGEGLRRGPLGRFVTRRLIGRQQQGFRMASGIDYTLPGLLPHGDVLLEKLGIDPQRRFSFMPTDLGRLKQEPLPHNERLRILGIARLTWVKPMPPGHGVLDDKRTDVLLRGLALFRERTSMPFELRLARKGLHIAATEALIDELGLTDSITWLDELPQEEFTREMIAADITVDSFGPGSIGMGARDAMALGRPLIANVKSHIFEKHFGEGLPVEDVSSEEGVAEAMTRLSDRRAREQMGAAARSFAERRFSAHNAARTILKVFDAE